jgi:transcriptional regulator with XRE-family HTH domain
MDGCHPLAEFRKRQRITQEALSDILGVSSITVSRWETGTRKIALNRLAEVSRLTGIPKKHLRPDLVVAIEEAADAAN